MSKKIKWIFFGGVFLVVGAVALIIILYLYTPAIDQAIITALNSIGGDKFKISYQNMSGNLLKRVRLDEVLVTFDDDSIFCKRVEFDYSIFRMTDREFNFGDIKIYQPTVILHEKENVVSASLESSSPPFEVPFDRFPDARIGRLSLSGGSLIIKNSSKTTRITNIQLALSGQISSDSLNISVNNLEGYWPFSATDESRGLLLNKLSFSLFGAPSRILLRRFEIDDKHVTMFANGEYNYRDEPRLSLDIDSLFVNLELAHLFLERFPYKEGYTKLSGKLVGMPSDFTGNIQLNGVFDSLQIRQLKTNLHRKGNSLQLSAINLSSDFGKLVGSIYIAAEGTNKAQLAISDANLKKIGILDEPTSISGNIDFDFDNWDLKNLSGRGRVSLPEINYGGVRFDSLKLAVDANRGDFRLLYPSKVVLSPQSEFFLSGDFSREQVLDVELTTHANRLDTLFDQIGMPLFEGGGDLTLKLSGPFSNPDLSGHIELDSLLNRSVRVYDVTGQIDIKRIIENRLGNFRLDILKGRVGNFELTKGTLKFSIEQNRVFMDTISFVSDQNEIATQGELEIFKDSVDVRLELLSLKYENYVIENSMPLGIRFRNKVLQFKNFELAASDHSKNDLQSQASPIEGFIRLEGTLALNDDNSNIDLEVSNTRLEPFNQFLNWKYQLRGVLTANVHIKGDISNPWLFSSLAVNEVFLDEHPVGSLDSRISYRGRELDIEQFKYQYEEASFANVSGTINLSAGDSISTGLFSPTNKVDLDLDIFHIRMEDYASLFDVNFPFQGAISGQMKIGGTMGAPEGILHLAGSDAIVKEYQFSNFDIDGRVSPTEIIVDKASVRFLDTDFQLSGFKGIHWDLQKPGSLFEDKSFALSCEVHEDSLNFLYAFIPEIDRIIGDIQADAQIAGTIDSPQLIDGSVEVRGADLYLTKIENPIQDVYLQAQVRNKKLYISECRGRSPEIRSDESFFRKFMRRFLTPVRKAVFQKSNAGDIQVDGSIDFAKLERPKFNLAVVLNDAYFNYFLENTRLVVQSDNLHISGGDTIAISGSAVVKKGVVDLNIEESEKNLLLSKSTRQTPPYIEYLLTVEVADNFFIRSEVPFNTFDIEIGGNTQILQEPMGLIEMYGELNIIKGKYFIQFEDFDITSGTINFINPKEYPELNLTAQKQKNNYLFDLTVSGPLNNPVKQMHTKNLDTNEEIYEIKDQMALLIFGVRFQELSGLGQSAFLQKGEEVLTQTIINQFEKEARYFTGLDRIRITTQNAEENYIDEFGNQADHISTLALGKYIAPNLYLEYQTKLSYIPGLASFPKPSLAWESGNQIYLKYRISQNWSLSSFYQKTLRGNDKVQFDVNWQLDF